MKRLLVALSLAGCSALFPSSDAGSDAGAKDVVATDTSGPYPCGAIMCGEGQYCIHPCCTPACASSVNGDCGFGTHQDVSCTDGCRLNSCQTPDIYCAQSDPCIGIAVTGRDAYCVCG